MTRRTTALDEATANAIFDTLVEHAGANEAQRHEFVYHQSVAYCNEFRFCGALGFGGKFWRNHGIRPDGAYGETWYVNGYEEDTRPDTARAAERRAAIATLAPILDTLRAAFEADVGRER